MARGFEHGSSDAPCGAFGFGLAGLVDTVDAGSDWNVGCDSQSVRNSKRMCGELNTPGADCARNVHTIVDDEPAAGGHLNFRKSFRNPVKRPS